MSDEDKSTISSTIPVMVFRKGDQIVTQRREFIVEDDDEDKVQVVVEKHNITTGQKIYGVTVEALGKDQLGRTVSQKITVPLPGNSFEEAHANITQENLQKGTEFLAARAQRKMLSMNVAQEMAALSQSGQGMNAAKSTKSNLIMGRFKK